MAKTTWGRKESIIWPYYRPLSTYSTIVLGVVLTGLFLCYRFAFSPESYRMLFVAGGRMSPRPAMGIDVMPGRLRTE